jgi:hypothetical protein
LDLEVRIAGIYNSLGNYAEALRLSLAIIKKAKELNDKKAVFFSTRQVMWIYGDIGDLQKKLVSCKAP